MQSLSEVATLHFRPDTLQVVRKDVNLDSLERINEAVDILEAWIKKQPHFVKTDYSRAYLENTIVQAKGLVERAKKRLDKLCTLRTLMPEYFSVSPDLIVNYDRIGQRIPHAFMRNTTKDGRRIFLMKVESDYDSKDLFDFYKVAAMLGEYLRKYDYASGYYLLLDYRDGNILNHIVHINPVTLKHMVTFMLEGYGYRIKGIYLITPSKAVTLLVTLFKQVLSAKLGSRIHVVEDLDGLFQHVPQEIMPVEYGGKDNPLLVLHDEWKNALTSEEFLTYFEEMNKAATVESRRPPDMFNEQYLGMAGSFRALTVD